MTLGRRQFLATIAGGALSAQQLPDIRAVPADLTTPEMTGGEPAPGKRVRQAAPEYKNTDVHHALYLPTDFRPGQRYPVIVEYAGNGNYLNEYGDVSTGRVEGSNLGYGLSAGKGFVWLCLPYVNKTEGRNEITWWGDIAATVEYAKRAVPDVCARFGGDPRAVILGGFSRGAIGCNFIGLHDDGIARLWRAFFPYSHYDGVREWPYPASDRASALARLRRLAGRPSFISHERSIDATRDYLKSTAVEAPFTFQPLAFRNHNDAWALRDVPERRAARKWLAAVLPRV